MLRYDTSCLSVANHAGEPERCKYSKGSGTERFKVIKAAGLVAGVPSRMRGDMANLLHASLANSTWKKYGSAWAALDGYQHHIGKRLRWPLQRSAIWGYVTYLVSERKLKSTTIRAYISALACLHRLKGFPNYGLEDDVLRALIRGAENLQLVAPTGRQNHRRVMTVAMLRYMGHRLARSGWERHTIQTIWTASLTAFFGTARMGELLSPSETWADPTCTLTWACVQYRKETDSFLLHIRLAKMRSPEGEFIDVFPFQKIKGMCPVAALKNQWSLQKAIGKGRPEDPVFVYPSGNYVTPEGFNKVLRALLGKMVDFSKNTISCHSFRAGLPSLISQYPELMSIEDIKSWGRWSGESYAKYTRLGDVQKRKLFTMISNVIA